MTSKRPSNISSPFVQGPGPSPWPPQGWQRARRRTVSHVPRAGAVALERLEGVGGAAGVEAAGRGPAGGEAPVAADPGVQDAGRRASSLSPRRAVVVEQVDQLGPGHRGQLGGAAERGRCPPAGGPPASSSRSAARRRRRTRLRTHGPSRRPCRPRSRPAAAWPAAPGGGASQVTVSGPRRARRPWRRRSWKRAAVGDPPELRARRGHVGSLHRGGHRRRSAGRYADRRLRPLSRRARTTARPARSDMRWRKPWRLARRRLFGW